MTNLPWKRCFTTKYFCIVDKTKHTEYIVVFPLQNGYANAPQCYVIRTLHILSFVIISLIPICSFPFAMLTPGEIPCVALSFSHYKQEHQILWVTLHGLRVFIEDKFVE
jgi:hypothetical protein